MFRSTVHLIAQAWDRFDRRVETFVSLNERLTDNIEKFVALQRDDRVLCGVDIHIDSKEGQPGGCAQWCIPGRHYEHKIEPQIAFESFELHSWGGAVITDVMVGRNSLAVALGTFTRCRFNVKVAPGFLFSVRYEVPAKNGPSS